MRAPALCTLLSPSPLLCPALPFWFLTISVFLTTQVSPPCARPESPFSLHWLEAHTR